MSHFFFEYVENFTEYYYKMSSRSEGPTVRSTVIRSPPQKHYSISAPSVNRSLLAKRSNFFVGTRDLKDRQARKKHSSTGKPEKSIIHIGFLNFKILEKIVWKVWKSSKKLSFYFLKKCLTFLKKAFENCERFFFCFW